MLATPVCAVRDGQERKPAVELWHGCDAVTFPGRLTGYLILSVMNKRRQKQNAKKTQPPPRCAAFPLGADEAFLEPSSPFSALFALTQGWRGRVSCRGAS